MLNKTCLDCKTSKPLSAFTKRNNGKWPQSYCKDCMVLRVKGWQNANKERFLKYQSAYNKRRYHTNEKYRQKELKRQRKVYRAKREVKELKWGKYRWI